MLTIIFCTHFYTWRVKLSTFIYFLFQMCGWEVEVVLNWLCSWIVSMQYDTVLVKFLIILLRKGWGQVGLVKRGVKKSILVTNRQWSKLSTIFLNLVRNWRHLLKNGIFGHRSKMLHQILMKFGQKLQNMVCHLLKQTCTLGKI